MRKSLILIILFSALFLNSETVFRKLLAEKDYFRAAGEYKKLAFENGKAGTASYYLDLAAIYALSEFTETADSMYEKATYLIESDSELVRLAYINSYLSFRRGGFTEAIFDIEDYAGEDDTLLKSVSLLRQCVTDNKKIDTIYEFLPDSVRRSVNRFRRITLRDPMMGIMMSSIYPGLGEMYSGDNLGAMRDFIVYTAFLGATIYALIKNRQSFSIDPVEGSWDYIKNRDWVLVFFLYNSFIARFQNGSKVNAEDDADRYNRKKYEQYLTGLYDFTDSAYRRKIEGDFRD